MFGRLPPQGSGWQGRCRARPAPQHCPGCRPRAGRPPTFPDEGPGTSPALPEQPPRAPSAAGGGMAGGRRYLRSCPGCGSTGSAAERWAIFGPESPSPRGRQEVARGPGTGGRAGARRREGGGRGCTARSAAQGAGGTSRSRLRRHFHGTRRKPRPRTHPQCPARRFRGRRRPRGQARGGSGRRDLPRYRELRARERLSACPRVSEVMFHQCTHSLQHSSSTECRRWRPPQAMAGRSEKVLDGVLTEGFRHGAAQCKHGCRVILLPK